VLVRSPSPDENRRFVRALGAALRARRLAVVRQVIDGVDEERRWIEANAPLLVPRARFDEVLGELNGAIDQAEREANPAFVNLDDESADDRLRRLRERVERERGTADRFPDGYIASRDGRTVLLRVTMAAPDTDVDAARTLVRALNEEVARLRPQYGPALRVHLNGDVANLLEEHAAILADVSLSSALVMLLVGALIAGYYRSARAVGAVLFALLPGVAVTFALARLAGSTLNSNSAFLGSIIVGNGINYPLVLLAYYRGQPPEMPHSEALVKAARESLAGVSAAAVTASAAYGGLAFTSFRGFAQFGFVGAVGMITVALVTFALVPLAVTLFAPPRRVETSTRAQELVRQWFANVPRARLAALMVLVALAVVGAAGARRAAREGLWDTDLRNLRNTDSLRHGAASWDRTVSEIFGTWLTPIVALAPDASKRPALESALRGAFTGTRPPMIERVESFTRYVPDEADQRERLATLDTLRRRIEALPQDRVPEDARRALDRWIHRPNDGLIGPNTVPETLRAPFTERDGRRDRAVLVFPSLAVNFDDARNVVAFASRVNRAPVPEGSVIGGAFLFMAEILRILRADAPRVIGWVCLLVALALVPAFARRLWRVPLVVITVAAVAVASQCVMYALGVRLNMLNFAALPITIGVGADYVVNLLGAMDSLKVDAREACARLGGAVLLCSLTTIVGYLTLLLASSGALRSFGQAAVLGEVVAVLVVLAVFPALARSRP
jgi:predicted exporter